MVKDWVVPFLLERGPGTAQVSSESYAEEISIPMCAARRLARCFKMFVPKFYDRERLEWIVGHTMSRLPQDIFQMLMALGLHFVVSDSIASVHRNLEPGAQITLNRISSLQDDEACGVTIHEICHLLGGELFGYLEAIGGRELEPRADELAVTLGFEEEISKMRKIFEEKEE